ncbi:ThiF family adenylyltransferase [Candidatus Hydrogenedentota bacterium]
MSTVVLAAELMRRFASSEGSYNTELVAWDNGDVYSMLRSENMNRTIPCTVHVENETERIMVENIGKTDDQVRIIVHFPSEHAATEVRESLHISEGDIEAWVKDLTGWCQASLQVTPVRSELFSRVKGLLETDVLADSHVFIAGLGTGGSAITLELAKNGVMNLDLMDHDRLEVGNIARHTSPLSHVGRYKTKSLADLIAGKNPYCSIRTWERKVSRSTIDLVRERIQENDLTVCCADSRPCRMIVNRLCFEENKPCIMGGVRRRAYGGQILRIRPRETICYQCFVRQYSGNVGDQEIATSEQAARIAYTDRPVAVEPGLSTDIAPMNNLAAKLAIQELLRERPTELKSLDEDFTAALYIWINRRESDSPFAGLAPLGCEVDGLRILRWYGIPTERDPGCPVCGNFIENTAARMGIEVFEEDADAFKNGGDST